MKHFLFKTCRLPFLVFLFCVVTAISTSPAFSVETAGAPSVKAVEQVTGSGNVNADLAVMSDEQVRSLLSKELSARATAAQSRKKSGGLVEKFAAWLHILDNSDDAEKKTSTGFIARTLQIPHDYLVLARHIGNGSFGRFLLTCTLIILVFAAAWACEFFMRRFTAKFRKQFQEKAIPDLDGPMRFIAGLMLAIPAGIHLLIFSTTALLFFFMLPVSSHPPAQYLFLSALFTLIFFRLISQLSQVFCSPQSPALRVLPLEDDIAKTVHNGVILFCGFTFSAIMLLALLRELGLPLLSFHTTAIFLASLIILMIFIMIFRSRNYVKNRILEKSEQNKTRNWVVEQFAQFWHIPTLFYFFMIWLIMVGDMLAGVQRGNSAFLMSLMILPLFVIFNGLGQWVVRLSINTLQISSPARDDSDNESMKEQKALAEERERKLYVTSSRIMSLAILATLLVWVLSLWDVHIPYATNITKAVFESLIAMALGLTVWRFASSYIEKKMQETIPETDEENEGDDEWGAAASRGRSFTILPMLRKFIATTLLTMVVLVVLSAIGVDIGPLLAGAGVVGLAIGFGAQKLVSDVFSGFFYLLDDAFRVGEYIQAGSVSGAVESITLRNVMLRHHRGMLQIVPHSELGSITNFMRGGIIVKFNLEFPYDADVDKIRKIIKKVGKAMLNDEEFGKDFIQPVKSAGVREITASVMVIRVKFKAQPGTHFVIRREAYRRITEALAAQGIHYAHRKVIVEIPEQEKQNLPENRQKLLEAGAAAALAQQEAEEKQKGASQDRP